MHLGFQFAHPRPEGRIVLFQHNPPMGSRAAMMLPSSPQLAPRPTEASHSEIGSPPPSGACDTNTSRVPSGESVTAGPIVDPLHGGSGPPRRALSHPGDGLLTGAEQAS